MGPRDLWSEPTELPATATKLAGNSAVCLTDAKATAANGKAAAKAAVAMITAVRRLLLNIIVSRYTESGDSSFSFSREPGVSSVTSSSLAKSCA